MSDEELKKLEEAVKFPFKDTLLPGTWNMNMDWTNIIAPQLIADLRDLREAVRKVLDGANHFYVHGTQATQYIVTGTAIDALRTEVEQTTTKRCSE